jgi:hypothetical protein
MRYFLANLPYNISAREVQDLFLVRLPGASVTIEIGDPRNPGKGWAEVDGFSAAEVIGALQGVDFHTRKMFIDVARQRAYESAQVILARPRRKERTSGDAGPS